MRKRACLLALLALLSAAGGAPAGEGKDETEIRAIITNELRAGILKKSPDLYMKSYLPTATVFSYGSGPVGVAQYHKILSDYFLKAHPDSVECEFRDLRVDKASASLTVRFVEKGKGADGAGYGEVYTRYFRFVHVGNVWKIETDGYNNSLQRIERMHGKPPGVN